MSNTLRPGLWSVCRTEKGAPVAADGSTSGVFPNRQGLTNCDGYDSILVGAKLAGGVAPDVDVEILAYDGTLDAFFVLGTLAGLADSEVAEATVYGARVFARIVQVTGNPTNVALYVMPGRAHP